MVQRMFNRNSTNTNHIRSFITHGVLRRKTQRFFLRHRFLWFGLSCHCGLANSYVTVHRTAISLDFFRNPWCCKHLWRVIKTRFQFCCYIGLPWATPLVINEQVLHHNRANLTKKNHFLQNWLAPRFFSHPDIGNVTCKESSTWHGNSLCIS